MHEWEMAQISDLISADEADLQTGPFGTQLKASEYVEEGVPVINVRNIGYGTVIDAKLEYITEKTADRLKVHRLVEGDIVFGRKGAVERHALIDKKTQGWIQGSDCLRLRIKSDRVSTKFLSHYFNTAAHKLWMEAQCSFGATMSSLNQDIVKRISYPNLPPATQKKIAAILCAYDELIENNRRRIALLERMAEEIYCEWFVRMRFPGHEQVKVYKGVPEGWETVQLGTLCREVRDGVRVKDVKPDTRYIGLEHIPRKSILLNTFDSIDSVQSSKLLFREHDILFGKIRPYLHKVALAHFAGVCSSDTIIIRPKKIEYEGFILLTVFSETFIELATISSKGTKMPRADWDFLKKLEVVKPHPELLSKYQKIFSTHFELMCNCMAANMMLKQTRDLLLSRLIAGKLAVDDLDIHFPPGMAAKP